MKHRATTVTHGEEASGVEQSHRIVESITRMPPDLVLAAMPSLELVPWLVQLHQLPAACE